MVTCFRVTTIQYYSVLLALSTVHVHVHCICVPVQVLCAAAVNPAVFLFDHQHAIKIRKETSPGPNGGRKERRSNGGDQEASISLVWVVTGVPNLTKVPYFNRLYRSVSSHTIINVLLSVISHHVIRPLPSHPHNRLTSRVWALFTCHCRHK